jgi:hypothetical protein
MTLCCWTRLKISIQSRLVHCFLSSIQSELFISFAQIRELWKLHHDKLSTSAATSLDTAQYTEFSQRAARHRFFALPVYVTVASFMLYQVCYFVCRHRPTGYFVLVSQMTGDIKTGPTAMLTSLEDYRASANYAQVSFFFFFF